MLWPGNWPVPRLRLVRLLIRCHWTAGGVLTFEGREVEVGLAVGAVGIQSPLLNAAAAVPARGCECGGYGEFLSLGKTVGHVQAVSGVGRPPV